MAVTHIKEERADELRDLKQAEGFEACLDEARDINETLICEGLHPPHYSREARAFAQELEKKRPSEPYLTEKLHHQVKLLRNVNRYGHMEDRRGTAESETFWSAMGNALYAYRKGEDWKDAWDYAIEHSGLS